MRIAFNKKKKIQYLSRHVINYNNKKTLFLVLVLFYLFFSQFLSFKCVKVKQQFK